MAKENLIREKSFKFAIRIVNLCDYLRAESKEYVIAKQLLRAGTAIGALVREAINAESKADFIHKLSVAQKEADETLYWLELLHATNKLNNQQFNSISKDATEVLKIIRSIILSTKKK